MKDDDSELIPKTALDELYKTGHKKIEELLVTSTILHNAKKYQQAILFSIIAFEESYKLEQIRKHKMQQRGFSHKEWNEITDGKSHKNKLVGMYRDALKNAKIVGKEKYEEVIKNINKLSNYKMNVDYDKDVMEIDHYVFDHMSKLNEIKKAILYFDWNKNTSKPLLLSDIYDEKTLGFFSVYIYDMADHQFNEVKLYNKYIMSFQMTIPEECNIMLKDKIWLNQEKYYKKLETPEYKMIVNLGKIILDVFPNPIPKKYFQKNKKSG